MRSMDVGLFDRAWSALYGTGESRVGVSRTDLPEI